MTEQVYRQFLSPGPEYRGKPFWAWNGKLEKEELIRQIHVMKEMGFGGFFMHSRTGLVTEYLGEEWFELINACADEAEKIGMEAWLYDEDRWPSGTAGGMVTVEPKYRLKFIYLEVVPSEEFSWSDNIIAAFSCRLDGVDFYDCVQIDQNTDCRNYIGKSILVYTIVEAGKSSFYNGYTYVDTMNREATERFLELTHEKYKKHCGERFGKSIKGIFTDEPHRGTLLDGFGVGNAGGEWHAPWTYTLFEKFKSRFGYDLIPKLPELFLKKEGRAVSQVKWQYTELLQEMFLENFAKPLNDWCEKNGLILTGHILHEDNLTAQAAMCGSVMRYYEYMGYPGIDVLGEYNESFWIVKQLSSAARQLGKKWLLSELYGCTGWQMDFEGHKAIGDWQALFGINLRCPHLSWYTMEGEAKRDYPASILHQSTWWKEYVYIEDYFSRIGFVMSQGGPCCDVLVVNPVESIWCQVYAGWSSMLTANAPEIQELEKKYSDVFHWLTGSGIDFDYGDEEMLSRMYSIDYDSDGNPSLGIGIALYKVVLIGGMTTIRLTTLNILKEFISAGGKVIFAGDIPVYTDALKSETALNIAEKAIKVPFERDSIVNKCIEFADKIVEISDASTDGGISDIFCQARNDGDTYYIMLLNVNRKKTYEKVRVKICKAGFAEEWDCASGERHLAEKTGSDGYITIETSFAPSEERLYVVKKQKDNSIGKSVQLDVIKVNPLHSSFEFNLDEPNICVLDMAAFSIDGEEWHDEDEILKVDQAVRSRFGLAYRGGEMLQPWFMEKAVSEIKGKVKLCFEFHIEKIPEGTLNLAIERPENFIVSINGHKLHASAENRWWVDKCFKKINIPSVCLVTGTNHLEMETNYHQGTGLEAAYLLGEFGVRLDGNKKTLFKMPDRINIGNLTVQGLPFYSGKVTYKIDTGYRPAEGERVFIYLGRFVGACIKVRTDKIPSRIIAWQPYEAEITDFLTEGTVLELDVVLARRNTFGPLHVVPVHQYVYGPESFVSEGEGFSKSYMLIESGLLEHPVIIIKRTLK